MGVVRCAAALVSAALLSVAAVQPASAVTVTNGSTFHVDFDATTAAGNVSAFLDVVATKISSTIFDLVVKLTNDTAANPGSRFSAFAFSLDPNATALAVTNPSNGAFTDDQNGVSWAKKTGFVPGIGGTEFCVGTGSNCQAANGGVTADLMDRLTLRLTFGSAVDQFEVTNFAGRFAAIGTQDLSLGVQGTTPRIEVVPLPASLPLLLAGIAGVGVISRKRQTA